MDSMQQKLPNSTGVLVLGILSILCTSCYGVGLILAIIALSLSVKPLKLYKQNPQMYFGYSNLKAGRITAIIGLSLSALYVILLISFLVLLVVMGISYDQFILDPTVIYN